MPMMPQAKKKVAYWPAKGSRAFAASSAVWISVMPWTWSVAAAVTMMKKVMTFEKVMPKMVSRRMRLISPMETWGIPTPIARILPSSISSSTSSSACQKNRYGEMVVPSSATMFIR